MSHLAEERMTMGTIAGAMLDWSVIGILAMNGTALAVIHLADVKDICSIVVAVITGTCTILVTASNLKKKGKK